MQLDKYISDIKDGIDALKKWPTKMLTERSIEINYTDDNIRLSGRVLIAFSVPNGHVNVRVSFYNYNCVRKDSMVLREMPVESVVKQVDSFVSSKRDSLLADNRTASSNRASVGKLMGNNGYSVDCDSKYMSVYKGKGIKVTFKFTDDDRFSVIVTKMRKKCMEKDIQFDMSFDAEHWSETLCTGLENIRKRIVPNG